MISLSVMVETHPEFTGKYRDAVLRHAGNTLTTEKGCMQFSVQEHASEPNRFFLYEVYASKQDFEEVHAVAPYLKEFGDLTGPWVKTKKIDRWEVRAPGRK